MLQTVVTDDKLAAAALGGLNADRGTEEIGQFLLQAQDVPVSHRDSFGGRWLQHLLNQLFDLAYRKILQCRALGERHLIGAGQGQQSPGVPHVDARLKQQILHRRCQLQQAQQVGRGGPRTTHRLGGLLVGHAELVDQSLQAHRLFEQHNRAYYASALEHTAQLSDSVEREQQRALLRRSEDRYAAAMAASRALDQHYDSVRVRTEELVVLIKLQRTLELMERYQETKRPDDATLKAELQRIQALEQRLRAMLRP